MAFLGRQEDGARIKGMYLDFFNNDINNNYINDNLWKSIIKRPLHKAGATNSITWVSPNTQKLSSNNTNSFTNRQKT